MESCISRPYNFFIIILMNSNEKFDIKIKESYIIK